MLSNAKAVDLYSRSDISSMSVVSSDANPKKREHDIEDKQLGFYMLLRGRCQIVFEVIKQRKLEMGFESSQGDPMMRQIDLYGG